MIAELTARYERVVIDTPPVLAVSDALVVAPRADIVCLVVRAQRTPRHSALRTCAALEKTGTGPAGIVLNRLPIAAAGYYYYYAGAYGKKHVYGEDAKTVNS
jgi:Mrp family chromosome partitioning ATPase